MHTGERTTPFAAALVAIAACSWWTPCSGASLKARAGVGGPAMVSAHVATAGDTVASKKYLVASFPLIKQVAYVHLPDTVWRPLAIGNVSRPSAIACDPLNSRVYVADQGHERIYWYDVFVRGNGLLMTDGQQHVAVDNVMAYWMFVNGVGDLYFTGHQIVSGANSAYDSIFRVDAEDINVGDALHPVEVYSRSDTGSPDPKAWMPSGIGVDSFDIFWGNWERGDTNGAISRGSRQNIGKTSGLELVTISTQVSEVRGLALTGTDVFFLTPVGLYGLPKAQATTITDPNEGLVIGTPTGADALPNQWDLQHIAYDGDGTVYFTDVANGCIYTCPARDTNPHSLIKFSEAPQVHGVGVMTLTGLSNSMVSSGYGTYQATAYNGMSQAVVSASAVESAACPRRGLAAASALVAAAAVLAAGWL